MLPDGTSAYDVDMPGVAGLDPRLLDALQRAATDASADDVDIVVNSGWRSGAYQEQLLDEAVTRYGTPEEAARWVATPATSAHVHGDAVDVGSWDATAWLSEHGADYDLCQIYMNETWHYELRDGAAIDGCPPMFRDPPTTRACSGDRHLDAPRPRRRREGEHPALRGADGQATDGRAQGRCVRTRVDRRLGPPERRTVDQSHVHRGGAGLRRAGVRVPVLSWLNVVDSDIAAAIVAGVDLAVPGPEMLHAIARAGRDVGRPARVHLHVDVGMARDGCPPEEWRALCDLARELRATDLLRIVGVMGHLSCADRPDDDQNARERGVFDAALPPAGAGSSPPSPISQPPPRR
nr:hypothetical protein GCM10025699_77110 [Microbacterium flavescens]